MHAFVFHFLFPFYIFEKREIVVHNSKTCITGKREHHLVRHLNPSDSIFTFSRKANSSYFHIIDSNRKYSCAIFALSRHVITKPILKITSHLLQKLSKSAKKQYQITYYEM